MNTKLKKLWQLLWGGLRYDPVVLLNFIRHLVIATKPSAVTELSPQTVLQAIHNGKSFIRLGDGEALILTGRDIYFQPTSIQLARELRAVVMEYSKACPYILGVPTNKLTPTEADLGGSQQTRLWRLYRTLFPLRFPQDVPYAPLTFFYVGGRFKKEVAPLLKDRYVIFISNAEVLNNDLRSYASKYFASSTFIETPATNAYAAQHRVRTAINTALDAATAKPVLLFAAGPASKVLAYEYAKKGVQSLDIGQGMKLIASNDDRSHKI